MQSKCDTPLLFVLYPYRYRHQCRQHCPQRTYEDRGRGLCISCIDPCVDCWSDALCLTCQSGYFLNSAYSTSSERSLSSSCLIAIAVSVTLLWLVKSSLSSKHYCIMFIYEIIHLNLNYIK